MKKRLLTLVLAVFLTLACVPSAVFADGIDIEADINDMYITRFKVETVNVDNDDETAKISVRLISNSGFAGLTYCLEYDTAALTLEQQPEIGDFEGFVLGPIDNVGWHMGQLSSEENIKDESGVLLTYTFKINPDATSGFYEIKFLTSGSVEIDENRTQELLVLDENLEEVKSDSISGGIVIPGYMVYYDANGGSGAPESHNKPKNGSVNISSTIPVREGFDFVGWATSSSAEEAEYEPGEEYSENADLTLYAVWKVQEIVAGSIDFVVPTVSAKPGDEVEVAINVNNHPGFGGLSFDVLYDNTKLDYISCEQKMFFNGLFESSAPDRYEDKVNFQVLVSAPNNVTATGELVVLKFKVLEAADGLAEISVVPSDLFKNVSVSETIVVETELEPNLTNGGVEIKSFVPGDVTGDGKVTNSDLLRLAKHFSGFDVELGK